MSLGNAKQMLRTFSGMLCIISQRQCISVLTNTCNTVYPSAIVSVVTVLCWHSYFIPIAPISCQNKGTERLNEKINEIPGHISFVNEVKLYFKVRLFHINILDLALSIIFFLKINIF